MTVSAYGSNPAWIFPPGTYGSATLTTHTAHNSITNYTGTGSVTPNPALSTTSAPYSGGWTGSKGGTISTGSFNGTLYSNGTGNATYTNGLGQVLTNSSISRGW